MEKTKDNKQQRPWEEKKKQFNTRDNKSATDW